MTAKQRLSASVDAELLQSAQAAVKEGRVDSISAWVNDALSLKAEHERRMAALDAFLAAYEAKHGVVTDSEVDEAVRRARGRAVVITGATPTKQSTRRRGVA